VTLPLTARALLRLTDPAVREFIEGDLSEAFDRQVGDGNPRDAQRWAVRQALRAVLTTPWRPRRAAPYGRGDGFMKTLLQDVRYGLRMMRKQPGYSLVVVFTLALAIGANSVIFSFASLLAIRPLPLRHAQSLGWIAAIDPQTGNRRAGVSTPEFLDYRNALTSFSSLAATVRETMTMSGRGDAVRLETQRVTANLVDVWGVEMERGRGFSNTADRPGAAREVILSHHFWEKRLAADDQIVGETLMLDGQPSVVVGVLAPDIEIGNLAEVDVWVPLELKPDGSRLERRLRVSGLLRPGVTPAQASVEVRQAAERLASEHPDTNAGWSARVAPTREAMTGTDTWTVMALLGTVVGFVLLIACANLANLVLSRGIRRRREIALRTALGASRARVVRQMLTENLLYGIAGGIAGLALAEAGLVVIRAASFERVFEQVIIDRNVLLFTTALALATPVLFGLLPALQASRTDVNEILKEGGARSGGGIRARRSRSILIVAQLGLAVALLVVTGLLVKALIMIQRAPVGFDLRAVLSFQVDAPAWKYPSEAAVTEYYDRLLARVRSVPGVSAAGLTDRLPLLGSEVTTAIVIDGVSSPRAEDRPWAVPLVVDDGYFAALGVPLQTGRGFAPQDAPVAQPVAVVNHEMARRFWGDPARALGAHITVGAGSGARRVRIIGIAGDVSKADREGANPEVFLSVRQFPRRDMAVLVRSQDPVAVQAPIHQEVRAMDPDVPIYLMRPLQRAIDEDMSSSTVLFGMFAAFAIIALVLAGSGLYAVVSYAANQRVQEFGVRMALGAVSRDIQWMMLRQMGLLVGTGLVIGLAGGRVMAMMASTLLYHVPPFDPPIYLLATTVLGTIALAASYGPVRRACRIDPVRALRLE
jgi:putative ABC transport system permease protein